MKKFLSLPRSMKLILFESWFLQLFAGLVLKILPFRKITKVFASVESDDRQRSHSVIYDIKQAIVYSGRLSPWKNECMVQSMAVRWMLNRRKISSRFYLGVTFDQNKKMVAHAWIKADNLEVVEKNGSYLELFIF